MPRVVSKFDLIAFDVDGTLVRGPNGWTVWELLNDRFTGEPEVNRERYARYKSGELSYADWVELDVSSWQAAGATREQILESLEALGLVDGVRETLTALREAGSRLIVISGTIDVMLHTLLPDAGFEEIYANHLAFDEEGRIGHWRATPFDQRGKAKLLRAVAMREGIPLERCAFVGDSSNDLWVAQSAGYAIAFNPDCSEFAEACDVIVRSDDLRDLLPYLT